MSHRCQRRLATLGGRVLAPVVVAAAVGLAGCSAGGGRPAASASRCSGPGVRPGEVNLGVIFPNSGTNASTFAAYRAGVEARLGVANASGGVGGRKITYHWADDGGSPSGNLTAAQELVRQDVFSVMEISTATAGGAAWLHERQVPMVGTGVDPVWSTYRNMFSASYLVALGPSISTWGDYIKTHGGRRAALLHSDLDPGSRIIFSQFSGSLKAAGIAIDPIEAETKSTSPADVVAQIARNHDDVITGSVDPVLFAQIAMGAKQTLPGQMKVIFSLIGYDKAFLNAFGKGLAGMSTLISYTPFEERTVPLQKFLDAMVLYSPQLQPAENEIALTGWIDADMTLTGLAAAGPCPTRTSFMTGLRNTTHYDAGGILVKPVNFKTNFGQLSPCYVFVHIGPTGTTWKVDTPAPRCGRALQ